MNWEAGRIAQSLSYFDDLAQGISWVEVKDLTSREQEKLLVTRAAKTEAAFNKYSLPVKPWGSHISSEFDSLVKKELDPN